MNVSKTNLAVDVAVWKAVYLAVDDAVYRAMSRAAYGAVDGTVVNAVDEAVYWAGHGDPPHPSLQDFLRFADVGET